MAIAMETLKKQHELLARLNRIPVWPYSNFIIFIVGIGFFFAFFDIITIGLSLPTLVKQFHSTLSTATWTITSGLIGYILGSFLDSRISDMFGRRLSLILSMIFFSVGSILSATSPNMAWLIFWRFIIGMGIGAEIANVTTYMAELAPSKTRGRYTSIAVCMAFMGFAIVPFMGLWLIPSVSWGWRALFVIGGIGGFVVLFARRHLPDSIRWHVHQNHLEIAEQKLEQAEALAEKKLGHALPEPQIDHTNITVTHKPFLQLLKPPYLTQVTFFVCKRPFSSTY